MLDLVAEHPRVGTLAAATGVDAQNCCHDMLLVNNDLGHCGQVTSMNYMNAFATLKPAQTHHIHV
jgi:hypothetical protein